MEIIDIDYCGFGITKDYSQVAKVLNNEIIEAKKTRKYFLPTKIIKANPHRIKPKCKHFDVCSGCMWQIADYEWQIKKKIEIVERLFGELDHVEKAKRIFNYRNKADLSTDGINIGFKSNFDFNTVFDLDKCEILIDILNQVFKKIRIKIPKNNLQGVILRTNKKNEVMLGLTYLNKLPNFNFEEFLDNNLKSINLMIQNKNISSSYGQLIKVYGKKTLFEEYLGKKFMFNIFSFMQPNPFIAEKLYNYVFNLLDNDKTLVELYAGVGIMSILLSEKFDNIFAYEIVKDAVDMAKKNADLNNVNNVQFYNLDSSEFEERADVLLVDPPRAGLSPKVLGKIIELKPKKIVYVSCNPITAYRDYMLLNYELKSIALFDMLPNTPRMELVIEMERK